VIDYKLVARAIEAYEDEGYRYVETPWLVGESALKATLPSDRHGFHLGNPVREPRHHHLVGSAEQGFLQMMLHGELQPGRYCSAGPCFRDEPVVDEQHQISFFKVELIHYLSPQEKFGHPRVMAHHADVVMWRIFDKEYPTVCVATESGYDLTVNGVEVGSYGAREHAGHRWVYGTGLALPRATYALRHRA
jgi:seryl-tRNA synthetase